jgi:hypothetical protein
VSNVPTTDPITNANSSILPPDVNASLANTIDTASNILNESNNQDLSSFNFPQNHMLNTTKDVLNRLLFDKNSINSSTDMSLANSTTSTSNFTSNYLNQEYLMLGDIIKSKPSSPSPSATSVDAQEVLQDIDFNMFPSKVLKKMKDTRPFISLGFSTSEANQLNSLDNNIDVNKSTSNFSHNTVNSVKPQLSTTNLQDLEKISRENSNSNLATIKPNVEYVSPLITHNIYQSVQDIYANNTMNFDYPQSYHSLTYFLKKRFLGNNLPPNEKTRKRNNLLIILKLIASYRPTFISAHKNLFKPQDLQFLEMTFQRSLIDYEKLAQLNSCPTIMWRRTGEIVSITDDLLSLLGYNMGDLLSKRTFIMELMYDDESIVTYFEKFKSIAVGNLLSSIQTKCRLMKKRNNDGAITNNQGNNQQDFIEFCSVWTVKRDIFDMPMLIIGQFLPVLPQTEGMRMY